MFNIGDEVYVRDNGYGVIVDAAGDTVYVEMTNGVEQEHHISALVNADKWREQLDLQRKAREANHSKSSNILGIPDILTESYRPHKRDEPKAQLVFKRMNVLFPGLVKHLNAKLAVKNVKFDTSSAIDHLTAICDVMSVPMSAVMAGAELGEGMLDMMLKQIMGRVFLSNLSFLGEYAEIRLIERAKQIINEYEAVHGK